MMTVENQGLKWPIQKHCGCYHTHQSVSLSINDFFLMIFLNSSLIAVTSIKLNYLDLDEMCLFHALGFGTVFRLPLNIWTAVTFPVPTVINTTQEQKSVTLPYTPHCHLTFPYQQEMCLH